MLMDERRIIVEDMHTQLHLMELSTKRKYHFDAQVFKCMNNLAPNYICNIFQETDLGHGTHKSFTAKSDLVI